MNACKHVYMYICTWGVTSSAIIDDVYDYEIQTAHQSILIKKAQGTLDLPQTSPANPVQCYSTRQEMSVYDYEIWTVAVSLNIYMRKHIDHHEAEQHLFTLLGSVRQ